MDYKKKYEEALERARQFSEHPLMEDSSNVVEYVFPELRESKDERIRKELITFVKGSIQDEESEQRKAYLAWLEKQGEQKSSDKVESRFHEGDWVACEGLNTARIVNINDDRYEVEFIDGNKGFPHIDYVDRNFHLWTIQDAKDGDVLVCGVDERPFIFKGLSDPNHPNCPVAYCGINSEGFSIVIIDDYWWTDEIVCPATKEQRDLLFQKMHEAGYEWNAGFHNVWYQQK